MVKIKTEEMLTTAIDQEINWRRLEIHYLKSILRSKEKSREKSVLIKSLVIISYSHWEGFVKIISKYYLSYIKFLSLDTTKISPKLIASSFMKLGDNYSVIQKIQFLESVLLNQSTELDLNIEKLVDAESNLKSSVLTKILVNIGASESDISLFESKEIFIDKNLLAHRNNYAHGERVEMDPSFAIDIADKTLELMSLFKNIIDNMICCKSYKFIDS